MKGNEEGRRSKTHSAAAALAASFARATGAAGAVAAVAHCDDLLFLVSEVELG
jgi:hypothetical protein